MRTHTEQYKNSAAISLNSQPFFLQQSAGLHVLPLTLVGMKIGINCIKLNQKSFFFLWHMDNSGKEVPFWKNTMISIWGTFKSRVTICPLFNKESYKFQIDIPIITIFSILLHMKGSEVKDFHWFQRDNAAISSSQVLEPVWEHCLPNFFIFSKLKLSLTFVSRNHKSSSPWG